MVDGVSHTHAYGYDARGRLVSDTLDGMLEGSWSYDANSNRLVTTPGAEVVAVYDSQDRLLEHGDLEFEYGENGELEAKTDSQSGEVTSYDYDEMGNLLSVVLPGGSVIEYLHDASNRRVGKKVDGVFVGGWVYGDQLNPVAEVDASGDVVASFAYASRGHVADYMVRGGQVYRLVTDHLGSVRAVVNANDGSLVQALEYDAWGVVLGDTNPGWQPFGFAGGVYEASSGLVRFGARDYDAEVGRWTGTGCIPSSSCWRSGSATPSRSAAR